MREPPRGDSPCQPCKSPGLLTILCRIWAILFCKRKGGDQCLYLPERVSNRPDPCIYSQFLLMQLGRPVTWDNPDVDLLRGGVVQNTFDLLADTEYEVRITVHNSSRDKPASGTQVAVRWVEFGAGGQIRHGIANLTANVPIWPDTAVVSTTWRTPASAGHYCIEVQLSHPDDGDPSNNLGWKNTQVKAASSPVETSVRIFNRWTVPPPVGAAMVHGQESGREQVPWNLVELTVDSYVFHDALGADCDPPKMFAPRPAAWSALVEPHLFHFNPTETYRDVRLLIDAPNGPGDPEVFNVNARQGGEPLGGVTVKVTRT